MFLEKSTLIISIFTLLSTFVNIIYSIYDKNKYRKIQTKYSENRKQFEHIVEIIADTVIILRKYPYSRNRINQLEYEASILSKKPLFYSNLDYNNVYAEDLRKHFNLMITMSLDGTIVDGNLSLRELSLADTKGYESVVRQDRYVIKLYQILDDYTEEYRRMNDKLI